MNRADIGAFLKLGVSVLAGVILIGIVVYFVGRGQNMANTADSQLATQEKSMNEMEFTNLEFTEVSGSTVVSKIKEYETEAGNLIVQVTTSGGGLIQYVSTGTVSGSAPDYTVGTLTAKSSFKADLQSAMDSTNSNYINPVGTFDVYLGYDSNGTIKALIFEQQ